MCGIAGIAGLDQLADEGLRRLLQPMADTMTHRGPDDQGFYARGSMGIAARRLSIIDVEGGHQPVRNEDGTIWAAQNGEIYNFAELRRSLESVGHQFRANTDTEVLVHLYEEYGRDMVAHLRGIFAFVVVDERRQKMLVARDRIGVKPLYYSELGGRLVFGSEIKAIFASGLVEAEPDIEALGLLLTLGYVPAPWTIFAGVKKLLPAHVLEWHAGSTSLTRYWEFPAGPEQLGGDSKRWEDEFMEHLDDAVTTELVSDVPLGVMLSGGIDSAAITALTARAVSQPVTTFHIGFEGDPSSEIEDARLVAQRIGTDHHEMTTELEDDLDFLARVTWHMDEPVSDLSALGFYRICRLAREHVTVALAGQGGDELLAGYRRYWGWTYSRWASHLPAAVYKQVLNPLASALPRAGLLKKASRTLGHADLLDWYTASISINGAALRGDLIRADVGQLHTDELLRGTIEGHLAGFQSDDPISKLLMLDSKMALPDDLLLHNDKMSMANSLEVRVPFLDYPMVEFCTRMPNKMKLKGFTTKYALRQGCERILPHETIHKRKEGFFGPLVNRWVRTEMRSTIEQLLLDDDASCLAYLDRGALASLVSDHMEGREDYGRQLMNVCMFELCLRIFVDKSLTVAPAPAMIESVDHDSR